MCTGDKRRKKCCQITLLDIEYMKKIMVKQKNGILMGLYGRF